VATYRHYQPSNTQAAIPTRYKPNKGKSVSVDQLKYPAWQAPLHELLHESDRKKLAEKLPAVERLIIERLLQLGEAGDGDSEQAALKDAATTLYVIKRDKLGANGKH
jgi:hypothetical protein